MNKQQLFSALIGTALTLGSISIASAGNPTWRYDEQSDSIIYAFSGSDHRTGGEADNSVNPQYGNQPQRHDAGPGGEAETPMNQQSGIWPWNDPSLIDSWN
jgi:hypothetical protein